MFSCWLASRGISTASSREVCNGSSSEVDICSSAYFLRTAAWTPCCSCTLFPCSIPLTATTTRRVSVSMHSHIHSPGSHEVGKKHALRRGFVALSAPMPRYNHHQMLHRNYAGSSAHLLLRRCRGEAAGQCRVEGRARAGLGACVSRV